MNELLPWLVPLLATGLVGLVIWVIRLAIVLTQLRADLDANHLATSAVAESLKGHVTDNKSEHDTFYNFGTKTEGVLIELSTLFKGMKEKQDSMDGKIDTLLNRRQTAR